MAFIDPDSLPVSSQGASAPSFVDPDSTIPMSAKENPLVGGLEAGMSMMAGLPSQIAGGVAGLGDLVMGRGLDAAADKSAKVQKDNFGLGAYEPSTKTGKYYSEILQDIFAKPGKLAGDAGAYVGKKLGNEELGRLTGSLPVDVAMNFLPLGVPVGVKKALTRPKKLDPKQATLDEIAAKKEAAQATKFVDPDAAQLELPGLARAEDQGPAIQNTPQQIAEMRGSEIAQPDLFGNRNVPRDETTPPIQPQVDQLRANESADLNRQMQATTDEMPYSTSVEEIARRQNEQMGGQGDMFITTPDSPHEVIHKKELQTRQEELARVNESIQKKMEIEAAYQQRIDGANEATRQRAEDARDIALGQLERKLREGTSVSKASMVIPKGQRGAMDVSWLDPTAQKVKEIAEGVRLIMKGGEAGPSVHAMKNGKEIGRLDLGTTDWVNPTKDSSLTPNWVGVNSEFQRRNIATEMYKMVRENGNDIVPSKNQTTDGKALNKSFSKNYAETWKDSQVPGDFPVQRGPFTVPKGQRGSAPFINDLAAGFEKLIGKQDGLTPEERIHQSITKSNTVVKGDAPERIIADALAEGHDGPSLAKNFQSGLQLAGDKVNSALMRGVARWINYADKVANNHFINNVKPLEQTLARLKGKDFSDVMSLMRREMFQRQKFTPEELVQAGFSEKQIAAYEHIRSEYDNVLRIQNEARVKLGKDPITPQNAYLASMWNGNYHVPVKNKEGRLVWYVKTETRGEANKAIAYLSKKFPELDLAGKNPEYHPENIDNRLPRDVSGAYQDMLKFFDGEEANLIKQAMQEYTEANAFKFRAHDVHFENKQNVRGFLGDRPWLSEKENAYQQGKAQIQYLKDAYTWAPLQEALGNIKEIISNPELIKQQPNNMEMTKAYVGKAMGLSSNIFKAAEQTVAKAKGVGISPGTIGKYVGDIKGLAYLQQLGMSAGYAIATPIQAFLLGPSLHMKLTNDKMGHNPLKTMVGAMADFMPMALGTEVGLSPLGREALKYGKENGILSQNIFDEYSNLGEHKALSALKQTLGLTISTPERVARAATFISFVHHLDQSGGFASKAEMFRKAEEYTNHTLTHFNRNSRPLAIDKLGQVGELAYTYKSAYFNMWNNLSMFARDANADWKNSAPLITALTMTALLAGPTNLPMVQELDQILSLAKKGVAAAKPDWYKHVANVSIEGSWLSKMAELSKDSSVTAALGTDGAKFASNVATGGLPSALSGTQLSSRFSGQGVDIANPMRNLAPLGGAAGVLGNVPSMAMNPSGTNVAQVMHDMAPPAGKGILENQMDVFKGPKQAKGQGYVNANKLAQRDMSYVRNPREEMVRNFGLTSQEESETKTRRFLSNEEAINRKIARDSAMNKMFDAVLSKNSDAVHKYARTYVDNYGDNKTFSQDFSKAVLVYGLTPEQRAYANTQSFAAVMRVKKMLELEGRK